MEPKRIAILGSTGSVGRQALDVIAADERLCACALAAGGNWRLLAEQARAFRPQAVAIADDRVAGELAAALPEGVELLAGPDAMTELVNKARPETVLTAMVGTAGLSPTLAAIECKADLAVANKESLVMAGAVIMPAARAAGIHVLPVDSEHSGVFQCLAGHRRQELRRVILTASGGPFRTWPAQRAGKASLKQVLDHPTWQMGRKITIDSATLMNKALEIVEAHWLFDLPAEKIEVVIHPESVVHGCVEFTDGSLLAQMGSTSMATPIGFALHYPQRAPRPAAPLDLTEVGSLHFERVDMDRFPAIRLGYKVVGLGGTAGAVLNAANETAVNAFVNAALEFGRIVEIVEEVLNQQPVWPEVTLEAILAADGRARRRAEEIIRQAGRLPQPEAANRVHSSHRPTFRDV